MVKGACAFDLVLVSEVTFGSVARYFWPCLLPTVRRDSVEDECLYPTSMVDLEEGKLPPRIMMASGEYLPMLASQGQYVLIQAVFSSSF